MRIVNNNKKGRLRLTNSINDTKKTEFVQVTEGTLKNGKKPLIRIFGGIQNKITAIKKSKMS